MPSVLERSCGARTPRTNDRAKVPEIGDVGRGRDGALASTIGDTTGDGTGPPVETGPVHEQGGVVVNNRAEPPFGRLRPRAVS